MKTLIGLLVVAGVVVGLLWMQGIFDTGKVGPRTEVRAAERAEAAETAEVRARVVPEFSEAVGTVRSRRTARVSPRIMGTILEVRVRQGDLVKQGDLLVRLDDREVRANLAAMQAGLVQAQARYDRAAAAYLRYSDLLKKGAATPEQMEAVTADYKAAKAGVTQAREAVRAAEIVVGYAEIRAPLTGVVAEKLADPGDLALPGRPVLVIQDPGDLRLEADVREYLIPHLAVGVPVQVVFDAPISATFATKIEERAPEADPATRTFRVKAPLPPDSGARPGNFGRLRFRTGERTVVLVPSAAVRRIGQLETVRVVEEGRVIDRHLRTGRDYDGMVEVLSGLDAGDRVLLGGR